MSGIRHDHDPPEGDRRIARLAATTPGESPKALQSDPGVQRPSGVSTRGAVTLVHFINRHNARSVDFKDYEFLRATVTDLWRVATPTFGDRSPVLIGIA